MITIIEEEIKVILDDNSYLTIFFNEEIMLSKIKVNNNTDFNYTFDYNGKNVIKLRNGVLTINRGNSCGYSETLLFKKDNRRNLGKYETIRTNKQQSKNKRYFYRLMIIVLILVFGSILFFNN